MKKEKILYLLVPLLLCLVLINYYVSYAYYNAVSEYPLIHSIVGNMYLNDTDYVLLIYEEDENNVGNYLMVNDIPNNNYAFKNYECLNNSTLIYNEETKTTSVTITGKELCAIYFDLLESL